MTAAAAAQGNNGPRKTTAAENELRATDTVASAGGKTSIADVVVSKIAASRPERSTVCMTSAAGPRAWWANCARPFPVRRPM